MDQVLEIRISGTKNQLKKGLKGKLNNAFLHFSQIFGIFILDDFVAWYNIAVCSTLKNHQTCQKYGKK